MTSHQALLLAQDRVKIPQKDITGDWYVSVYTGKVWKRYFFITDSEAWAYFYKCIVDLKQQFLTQEKTK